MDRKHPPRKWFEFIEIVLLILSYIQFPTLVQNDTSTNPPPVLTAAKLTDARPQIDGYLNKEHQKERL